MRLDLGMKGFDDESEQRALSGVREAQEYVIKAMAHLNRKSSGVEGAVAVRQAWPLLKKIGSVKPPLTWICAIF